MSLRCRGGSVVVATLLALGCRGPTPAQARREAQIIWNDRCTNCHGPAGEGNGPGAKILPVKPRRLADRNWQRKVSDEHIAKVIVDGGESQGKSPFMAANPDLRVKPEVVEALVSIVRNL